MELEPAGPIDHAGGWSAPAIDVGDIVPLDELGHTGKVTLASVDTIWVLNFRAVLRGGEGRGGEEVMIGM